MARIRILDTNDLENVVAERDAVTGFELQLRWPHRKAESFGRGAAICEDALGDRLSGRRLQHQRRRNRRYAALGAVETTRANPRQKVIAASVDEAHPRLDRRFACITLGVGERRACGRERVNIKRLHGGAGMGEHQVAIVFARRKIERRQERLERVTGRGG